MERYEGESRRDAGRAAGRKTIGRPWRKGQSGNPAGRPPRPRATGAPGDRLIGADEPTRSMILAEAYRTISVTEGGETYRMQVNQAVFRVLTAAALGGNRLALQRWTRIVREAEREQRAAQHLIYNAMEVTDSRRDRDASYDDDIVYDRTSGNFLVRSTGE
ncbi:MAG: DUF5681 domain-containing protein [Pseudomonadota bacterium]